MIRLSQLIRQDMNSLYKIIALSTVETSRRIVETLIGLEPVFQSLSAAAVLLGAILYAINLHLKNRKLRKENNEKTN